MATKKCMHFLVSNQSNKWRHGTRLITKRFHGKESPVITIQALVTTYNKYQRERRKEWRYPFPNFMRHTCSKKSSGHTGC